MSSCRSPVEARGAGLGRTYGGLLECIAAGGLIELGHWDEADRLTETLARHGPERPRSHRARRRPGDARRRTGQIS